MQVPDVYINQRWQVTKVTCLPAGGGHWLVCEGFLKYSNISIDIAWLTQGKCGSLKYFLLTVLLQV